MRILYSYQGKEEVFDSEKAEAVIGRLDPYKGVVPNLDLTSDRFVSRRHARIWVEKGQYWIEDLGSKNGTFVEGVKIKGKVVLKPGVSVRMGNTILKLVEEKRDRPLQTLKLRVVVKCLPTVNYSLAHADVPFLLEATVFNDGDEPLRDVKLEIVLPDYAKSQLVTIPSILAKGSHMVDPLPPFQFYHSKMRDLPEPETVLLEVWVNRERVPLISPVKVLPPNAWHCIGHEAALAGLAMPHSDAVNEIVSRARFYLRRLLKGVQGFVDALESSDPKALEKTVKALYFCLQERYNIAYEYEPRTYAPDWQMARFHHEVLEELEGTCIDLAVLFAACLESIHRDPLIIVVKIGRDPATGTDIQHAVIGCWRKGTPLMGAVINDETQVRQWVTSGEILVLDSKGFPQTKEFPEGMTFADCQKQGIDYVENHPLCYALDVVAARDARIAPMPFGKGVQFDRSTWLAVFRARQEAERLQSSSLCARHLLLGLLSLDNGLMRQVFAQFGDDMAVKVSDVAWKSLPRTKSPRRPLEETGDWKAIMRHAEEAAAHSGTSLLTEADLASALLETPSQVDKVLALVRLTRQRCLDALGELVEKGAMPSDWDSSGFT